VEEERGEDVLLVYSSWERRRCTAFVFKWEEEEEMYCWCNENGRGSDVLLVYSSGGGGRM